MVSHPTTPSETPGEDLRAKIRALLRKDPLEWSPDECLDALRDAAALFLSRGKRSPGMSPVSARYGHPKAFYYVDPDIVTYDGDGISSRTRVCEVLMWQPHHDPSMALLLTSIKSGPLFLLERAGYDSEPVWLEGPRRDTRQYRATSCTIEPAEPWLRRELEREPYALITIIEALEEIFGSHCEAGRLEQTDDERVHGQLSVVRLMLKG